MQGTRVVIIDNYDSFTYNLAHAAEQYCEQLTVIRNSCVNLDALESFHKIILSPGPGLPHEAPIIKQILQRYAHTKPIMGVCLGMQAIGEFFGADLYNLPQVDHGIPLPTHITDSQEPLFKGVPTIFDSGRYHSWAIDHNNFPKCLKITAVDPRKIIMAIRHQSLDICGVQFHPESIMTPWGNQILKNWMNS